MKLSDLKLNPNNPQKYYDLAKLEKSITEFPKMMRLRPLVYDPENMIVLGGNKRLISLRKLGYKEIPDDWVISTDEMTDDEKKRFIIADNVMFGEWDMDILAGEDWEDELLEDWGVDLFEIVDDEDMLSKASSRGDMSTGGIKIIIGNFTRYIAPDNELIELAVQTQDKLIEFNEEERETALWKILELFTS